MDLLQAAQHRFEQLASRLRGTVTEALSDDVEGWLRTHVAPVAAALGTVERFREAAIWSVRRLSRGSGAPERRQVEAADDALAGLARDIAAAAGGLGTPVPTAAAWLAGRPWFDLVCPEEYFTGDRELHAERVPTDLLLEFRSGNDPRVPLGDYVGRGMFSRTEFFAGVLGREQRHLFLTAQQRSDGWPAASRLFAAQTRADQAVNDLRAACRVGNESGLREACAALAQASAAYDPCPDLSWLGPLAGHAAGVGPLVRSVVRPPGELVSVERTPGGRLREVGRERVPLCRPDIAVGIAAALAAVAGLYRVPVEPEDRYEALRRERRLVLYDGRPRKVSWDGVEIDRDWDRPAAVWELFRALVEAARRRQPVDREALVRPGTESRALKDRRARLGKLLPPDLDARIEDVRPGGYRLALEPDEIEVVAAGDPDAAAFVGVELLAPVRDAVTRKTRPRA